MDALWSLNIVKEKSTFEISPIQSKLTSDKTRCELTIAQILIEYSSVDDYIDHSINNPILLKPPRCDDCGCLKFNLNGFYDRKSENRGKEINLKNGTLRIRRFKCYNKDCGKNYSILPSLISPRRWYLWCMQQYVLKLALSGISIKQVALQSSVARSTISRWLAWFKARWSEFCNELMAEHSCCSGITCASQFYSILIERWRFHQVMHKLHQIGLVIP